MTERKPVVPITEGKMSKGGLNPPNISSVRPPAPQGSGGKATEPKYTEPGWYVVTSALGQNLEHGAPCYWHGPEDLKTAQHFGYKLYPVPAMTEQVGEPGKGKG